MKEKEESIVGTPISMHAVSCSMAVMYYTYHFSKGWYHVRLQHILHTPIKEYKHKLTRSVSMLCHLPWLYCIEPIISANVGTMSVQYVLQSDMVPTFAEMIGSMQYNHGTWHSMHTDRVSLCLYSLIVVCNMCCSLTWYQPLLK